MVKVFAKIVHVLFVLLEKNYGFIIPFCFYAGIIVMLLLGVSHYVLMFPVQPRAVCSSWTAC